jgi:hypothetical protein
MLLSAPALHAPWLRGLAQFFSYLLHPVFIPGAMAAWLLMGHPMFTLLLEEQVRVRLLAMVLLNTVLFPVLIAFLLWRLGFTKSLQMETQRERIYPLIINIIFYFWAWNVSRNLTDIPLPLVQWLLGVFLCGSAAMFTNIFLKISLHTIAMGGLIMFSVMMMLTDHFWPFWMLPVVLLIAGLTGTARLLREAHSAGEVYAGYLAGAICQLAGWYIAG